MDWYLQRFGFCLIFAMSDGVEKGITQTYHFDLWPVPFIGRVLIGNVKDELELHCL